MIEAIYKDNGEIYSVVELCDETFSLTVGEPRGKFTWEPEEGGEERLRVRFDKKAIPQLITILQKFKEISEKFFLLSIIIILY